MIAMLFVFGIPLFVVFIAMLCGWAQGDFTASAGEAGTAKTTQIGLVHEHAVPNGETPDTPHGMH